MQMTQKLLSGIESGTRTIGFVVRELSSMGVMRIIYSGSRVKLDRESLDPYCTKRVAAFFRRRKLR